MDDSRTRVTRVALFAVRLVVGGAFAYAGWMKARDPAQFIRDVWGFHMLPESAAFWVAAFVPYLEIVAGLALITGLQRRGAHLLLAAMLLVFIASLGTAWARGLDVACGCFGGPAHSGTTGHAWPIARDVLLLAGVAVSAFFDVRRHEARSESVLQ